MGSRLPLSFLICLTAILLVTISRLPAATIHVDRRHAAADDDNPGTAEPTSFEHFRATWVSQGCQWFQEEKKPDGWSLSQQIAQAGIKL